MFHIKFFLEITAHLTLIPKLALCARSLHHQGPSAPDGVTALTAGPPTDLSTRPDRLDWIADKNFALSRLADSP